MCCFPSVGLLFCSSCRYLSRGCQASNRSCSPGTPLGMDINRGAIPPITAFQSAFTMSSQYRHYKANMDQPDAGCPCHGRACSLCSPMHAGDRVMITAGRVVFSQMDEVVFGRPAADAVAEQTNRLTVHRVFLMVSGTLGRTTDEITRIRQALGNRCAGVFDRMPPHTPRQAVIAATEQARA